MNKPRAHLWLVGLVMACGGSRAPTPLACGPVDGPVDPSATTETLEGDFDFTMVATSGRRNGAKSVMANLPGVVLRQ